MARYQATVQSPCPPAETFAYLATFSNAADWDPGVLAGEQIDPGPVRDGTRFRLVVPFLGRRLPLTYQVTSYQPDREVVLTATSGLLGATDTITVTGGAAGSAVSYQAEVRLRGVLRILDPLLRPGFRTVADRAAAGLAHALAELGPHGSTAPPASPQEPGTPARSGRAAPPPPRDAP
jgi:Polyketide cyclase / dehydrase and lipid transport